MASFRVWMKSFRLRTLPLAISTIAMGGFLSATAPGFNLKAVIFAGVTTLLLQILSNLANDYGDAVSGIDNDARVGPKRTVQSGEISKIAIKRAIWIVAFLAVISGLLLLFYASSLSPSKSLLFLLLGLGAVIAAITYTVGDKPYGYSGLGDLFVFVFFGLVGVKGTFYLATLAFDPLLLLPAAAIGMLSAGVINLNNMRDLKGDLQNGKTTVAGRIGIKNAFYYHCSLVLIPFLLLAFFNIFTERPAVTFLFLMILPPCVYDLVRLHRAMNEGKIDPFLPLLSLKTLALTFFYGFLLVSQT